MSLLFKIRRATLGREYSYQEVKMVVPLVNGGPSGT